MIIGEHNIVIGKTNVEISDLSFTINEFFFEEFIYTKFFIISNIFHNIVNKSPPYFIFNK